MQRRLPQFGLLARNQSRRRLRFWFAFATALAGLAPAVLPAATFTAGLDRDTVTVGESVILTLTFEGGQPKSIPAPPSNPNLQVADRGTSQNISGVNGRWTSTISETFELTPTQPGEYTIPPLQAEVDGQILASRPLKLKALKPGAPPPEAVNSGSQPAFFKLFLPKKEMYLGEVVAAELQLYLSDKVQNFGNFQLAALPADGFTVGKMVEGQRRRVQFGNAIYRVIPIAFTLRPVKTGPLNLGPVTASVVVELPSPNRRRDMLDPFGMLSGIEQRQVALATDLETVQSLPLPSDNAPPNFDGAVGSYALAVTAGPTNVAAGDPITVKIQLSGRGALDSLELPDQPAWHDFKVYPSTSKIEMTDALGVTGRKLFEELVVPQNPDIKALPPMSFSYFDSDKRSYQTLTAPPIALVVRPGGSTIVPATAAANRAAPDNPPPAQDIVPIKQHPGELAQIRPPLARQSWFLALQSVPLLGWLCAAVWRKRSDLLANNPRLRRQRQVAQIIREGLNDLRKVAAQNNSDEFFAILVRLLQEQLGERLDLPASAITEAVIEEHLRPAAVPELTLQALRELFQTCNLARYAPVKTSQELAALIPKIEIVLHELQKLKA